MIAMARTLSTLGVLARARTRHGLDIRLVEVAAAHGWHDECCADAELAMAGHTGSPPSPDVAERLSVARRDALSWIVSQLDAGVTLVELPDSVVILPRERATGTAVEQGDRR